MDFKNKKEQKEFLEIATMLNYYKAKSVPIPEEVLQMLEDGKEESDVIAVLNDIAKK